ncbi:hypothetical protein PIB30_011649 [Stylosanthes scabra]|uniref:Uncharacterized protein n=1 Tax=Stylosanthes scabra TaxID=79078 RepID=A0ABU6W3Y7_9FABA|nr:hypothetical protein [Stylosanthes scabra]
MAAAIDLGNGGKGKRCGSDVKNKEEEKEEGRKRGGRHYVELGGRGGGGGGGGGNGIPNLDAEVQEEKGGERWRDKEGWEKDEWWLAYRSGGGERKGKMSKARNTN